VTTRAQSEAASANAVERPATGSNLTGAAAGNAAADETRARDATAATPYPNVPPNRPAALGAAITLAALALLCVAWEWWLAPLRPGGTAFVLKALPLAIALPGVLRQRIYTLQWASMLVLFYFAEGIVRGMTDRAPGNRLGWIEVALALGFFACALVYIAPFKRAARRTRRRAG
jgi:uncharacterized membrane protein